MEDEAVKIASKSLLPEDDPKAIAEEAARLKRYQFDWRTKPRLDAWIRLLDEDGLLSSQIWLELADNIEAGVLEQMKVNFGVVRDEIQKNGEPSQDENDQAEVGLS